MVELEVKLDDSQLPASLNKLAGNFFDDIVEEAVHTYLDQVAKTAKRSHRYKRRTGALERSIRTDKHDNGGSVYIDDSIAPYGEYVHDGTKHIIADPFLMDAEDNRLLDNLIDKAVDKILQREGLQ